MTSSQLSPNFKRREFACKCGCGFAEVDLHLIYGLEKLREAIGDKPITVTSACRCSAHNKAVGGASGSMHLKGQAADIQVRGMTAKQLYSAAEKIREFRDGGIGLYKTWIHVDLGQKRRW